MSKWLFFKKNMNVIFFPLAYMPFKICSNWGSGFWYFFSESFIITPEFFQAYIDNYIYTISPFPIPEREFRAPSLGSLENCMKLSQMTVQGLQQFKSPLLQLPHIEEDNLRRVSNHKKVRGYKWICYRPLLEFLVWAAGLKIFPKTVLMSWMDWPIFHIFSYSHFLIFFTVFSYSHFPYIFHRLFSLNKPGTCFCTKRQQLYSFVTFYHSVMLSNVKQLLEHHMTAPAYTIAATTTTNHACNILMLM